VVIGKVLPQLIDARTFVRNQVGIKTGYTQDVHAVYHEVAADKDDSGGAVGDY
jgi:hypothetical protein